MEENQNGMNGQEAPRTYGEESKIYENRAGKSSYGNQPGQQDYGNQPNQQGYGNQSYQNGYGNQPGSYYQQPNYNPYGQQPYGNGYGMPQYGQVRDIFCYFLLVIMPLRAIISMIANKMIYDSVDGYESILDGSYLNGMMGGAYSALSAVNNLLFLAFIVFAVLDIVAVHKGNYKITGLILFAIFLNPGYYIWRAYVLRQKKTVPVIYTVVYSLLFAANIIYSLYRSFEMAFEMVGMMY